MRIAFLSAGQFVPSSRFRLPFYELLQQRGHKCSIFHSKPEKYEGYRWIGWRLSQLLKRSIRRIHLLKIRHGNYDAVVLDRGLFHTADWSLEKQMRPFTKRLILEVDDAVFLQFPEKMAGLAKLADHVIAGNEALAQWLRPHSRSLSIIPTCVDLNRYAARPKRTRTDAPVIGWIGSAGNVAMLQVCAAALRRLSRSHQFVLRVISGPGHALSDINLSGVDVQWIDYRTCDEINELHRMDIGIMPLPEGDPYIHFKCNAKMVQYLTVGLPAVGSAIGFNHTLIQHGINGFLANNDSEWYDSLEQLLNDPELQTRIAAAGRQSMLESYTVQRRIEQFEQILHG